MKSVLDAVRKVTSAFVVVLFAIVVVVVFAQVVARFVLGTSIRWADELSRFAFVWLVYIGGSITVRDGRNVCFDLFLASRKGMQYKVLFTFVCAASALFLVSMTWLGFMVCKAQVGEFSPIMRWPMAAVCAAIPLGGVLMFFEQISYYLGHLNRDEEEEED